MIPFVAIALSNNFPTLCSVSLIVCGQSRTR